MKTVSELQNRLLALGFNPGPVDGLVGPTTAKALSDAILSGKMQISDPILVAAKRDFLETPTRRNINDVYGTPKYRESTKNDGRIVILNSAVWQKNFCQIVVDIVGMAKPINLMVHKKIACQVLGAFAEIEVKNKALPESERWVPKRIDCYCPRHNQWDTAMPLTVHTWAAAIDIDPTENMPHQPTNIPVWAIHILQTWGAIWGGDWNKYPDPMHFQWMR